MIPKKILFCADFSENSEPARLLAVEYAKAFGAHLLILHVIHGMTFSGFENWIGDENKHFMALTEEEAVARLQKMAEECRQQVSTVKTFCQRGLAPYEIVKLAKEESADLIVLGTHGRTGVKHLVMGSVARSVLRMAHRPVLIEEGPPGKGESSDEPYEFPVP
jgi:universal stress protein A